MSGSAQVPARRWPAFWVCTAATCITILDITKVNVALPSIETALGAGSTALQLVFSGFVLALGLLLVPMGRIGDQRSRRTLFVVGLALFTLSSAACALAPSIEVLLIGRVLQGVAAGITMPQSMGLIQELFPGRERGRAFGTMGAVIGLSTAFGPVIGGLSIAIGGAADGWRGIFWMNVPLCLAVLAFALRLLPRASARARGRLELDPVGVLLFGGAIVALLLPFLFTTGSPDDPPARWWALVACAALVTVFVLWERRYAARGNAPLIPPGLFAAPSFRNGVLVGAAYFAGMPAMFLLTTLFLQGGLHLTALHAGSVTVGFALSSAVTSWVGGRMVARRGRALVVVGLGIMAAGLVALVLAALFGSPAAAPWLMTAAMVLGGLGGGLVVSPNQTLMYSDVPVHHAGVAGSVGQLGQRMGTTIGSAVALSLFYATIFREGGDRPALVVHHDAYAFGMLAVGVCLAVALGAAIADLAQRRRSGTGDAGAS